MGAWGHNPVGVVAVESEGRRAAAGEVFPAQGTDGGDQERGGYERGGGAAKVISLLQDSV